MEKMLYTAKIGKDIIYIGTCDRNLEAWQAEAARLYQSLGKTPAMKPLRLLELICKTDEELEQARKVLVLSLKPIGNWSEWSQFEEDWSTVSYWREAKTAVEHEWKQESSSAGTENW